MQTYTPEEVAEMLKVSRMTIYRYLKSGKIRSSKIGQQYRVSEEQLKDFFNANETKH